MGLRGSLIARVLLLGTLVVSLLVGLAVGSGTAATDPDLVGEWHLDQIAAGASTPDSSGNGLTGSNVLATPTPGRFGNALQFNSIGDGVDVADNPALRPNRMTVMAWVKDSSTPLQFRVLVGKGADACESRAYVLDVGSLPGHLRFSVSLEAPSGDSFTTSSVTTETPGNAGIWDGQWHAVAGTYDGSVARLYVDGHEVSSTPVPTGFTNVYYSSASTNDPRLSIGRYVQPGGGCDQSGFQYLGAIDEVRIYKRALSATEVNYLQTAVGATSPELPPPSSTTTTSTTTSTTSTGGGTPPPVAHLLLGQSAKLAGAVRVSGLSSQVTLGKQIVNYNFTIHGPGGTVDEDCGKSPVLSLPVFTPGHYKVLLTVTDSSGQKGSATSALSVPQLPIAGHIKTLQLGTFDCENPAAGEQPSTADCVKSFGFGILDVNSRGGPADCFQVTGENFVKVKGHLGPGLPTAWDAKIGGPVAINGLYVPIPNGVKSEYDTATSSISATGLSSIPVRIGPFETQRIPINLKITPNTQGVFHAIDVDQAAGTPKFLGSLPIRGAFSIDLTYHASKVKIGVGLPVPLSFGPGKTANGDAYLISDNVNGLQYDGLSVLVPNVWLGPIFINSLSFKYVKSQDLWQGGAKITLPGSTLAIDAAGPPTQPPDFGFGLKNGHFDHAGFAVDFSPPTQPDLFPPFHTVLLSHIGAAIGLSPLRLTGTIGISANGLVDEDGALFGAFATPDTPYTLPDNVGPELAPLAGRTLDSFTLAIGGTASIKVPILGAIPLVHAYGLYEYPDYFEFGGGFSFGISFLQLSGGVSGFVFPSNHTFNIEAGLKACLRGIDIGFKFFSVSVSPCINVGGVISSQGIGFCGILPVPFPLSGTIDVPIGAGYRWGASTPDLMVFSCDYGPYRQVSPLAARDAAAVRYSITLPQGLPAAMFRIRGQVQAPQVTVTDPRGRDITASSDAITLGGTDPGTRLVALRHPIGGTWTITAKPGSVPIVSVASSDGLPAEAIRARISGRGLKRILDYHLVPAAGRTVTFVERGPSTIHVIGKARGRSGRIVFTPGTGRAGRRSIIALVSEAGAPAHTLAVAAYIAPRPAAPRTPGHLRATRHKGSIRVSWARTPRARRYEVLVSLTDHSQVFRVVSATHAVLTDPSPHKRGKVFVDALTADGKRSQAASVTLT